MPKSRVARIYRGTPRNLAALARALRAGELVAVSTETVYGLAANAFDTRACRKIFRAKGRPAHDPLIVHIHSLVELTRVARPNAAALTLAKKFWPGPLTIVLPKTDAVPSIVTAGLPSVAVRMPAHPVFRRLLRMCGLPLAAPSANLFGYVSPTTAQHVRTGLGKRILHILDGGAARIGLESTIVDLRDPSRPVLLRPGAVTRADLERALGRKIAHSTAAEKSAAPIAPGMLVRHYSPCTPITLHESLPDGRAAHEAWVFFARPEGTAKENTFWLSMRGSLSEAARRLFALLRQLDGRRFKRIHIELARGDGLAEAINDRLRRAAARESRR